MADTHREERAARNQAFFREVNERISDLNEAFAEITDGQRMAYQAARKVYEGYCK